MTDWENLTDADFERLADEAEHDPAIRAKVAEALDRMEREGKIVRKGDGYVVLKTTRREQ